MAISFFSLGVFMVSLTPVSGQAQFFIENQTEQTQSNVEARILNRLQEKVHVIDFDKINLSSQDGHVCKIAALANLDFYHATKLCLPNIPLRKNKNYFYDDQLNDKAMEADIDTSFRAISKEFGSLQGEILSRDMLVNIATKAGYSSAMLHPYSLEDFVLCVSNAMSKNHPLMACFSVNIHQDKNIPQGFPSKSFTDTEHACLILGINVGKNTLTIAHWGEIYPDVPIDLFYHSMNVLPKTRQPEVYIKTVESYRDDYNVKYQLIGGPTFSPSSLNSVEGTERHTSVPLPNSGFKNCLFHCKPDFNHPRWKSA